MLIHLTTDEKGVAAVVMIIVVIIVLLTLIGGLVLLTSTGYKSCQFSKDRVQALYLAEAGLSSAIREIKGDGYLPFDYDSDGKIGSISSTSLGDGSYSVDCATIMPSRGGEEATGEHGSLGGLDDPQYYQYQLTSTGEMNGVSRQAQATYKVTVDIEEFKESKYVAYYTSSCSDKIITEACQTEVLPSPIMGFFRNNADYIKSGFTSSKNANLAGVYYVQGDAKLKQKTTLKGTIIVDGGTLTIGRECIINPSKNPDSSDFPAIVVYGGTGEVIVQNKTTIKGLIYASNSVNIKKECTIKGVIIADVIEVGKDNKIKYKQISPPGFWGGTSASGGTTRKVSLESGTWQSS